MTDSFLHPAHHVSTAGFQNRESRQPDMAQTDKLGAKALPMLQRECIHPSYFTRNGVHQHIDSSHLHTGKVYIRTVTEDSFIRMRQAQTLDSGEQHPAGAASRVIDGLARADTGTCDTGHQVGNMLWREELAVMSVADIFRELPLN